MAQWLLVTLTPNSRNAIVSKMTHILGDAFTSNSPLDRLKRTGHREEKSELFRINHRPIGTQAFSQIDQSEAMKQ